MDGDELEQVEDDLEEYRELIFRMLMQQEDLELERINTLSEEYTRLSKEPVDFSRLIPGDINDNIDHLDCSIQAGDHTERSEIADSLGKILQIISQKLKIPGNLIPIGSTASNTCASDSTDFDYIFELSKDIRAEQDSGDSNKFIVFDRISGEELSPKDVYFDFARQIHNLLTITTLPEGINFGGFDTTDFSGIRCFEPAVTVLFTKTCSLREYRIPIDITVGFQWPKHQPHEFSRSIQRNLSDLGIASPEDIDTSTLHLVAVTPYSGRWWLTSAVLETSILRKLAGDRPEVIEAIRDCKLISQLLPSAVQPQSYTRTAEVTEGVTWITTAVQSYWESTSIEARQKLRVIVQQILEKGHRLLTIEDGEILLEFITKHPIALNSSAIKYQVLNHSRQIRNRTDLVSKTLDTLSQNRGLVDHTFLPIEVRQYTIASYCAISRVGLCNVAQAVINKVCSTL